MLTAFQFAIARAHAQLLAESKTRQLTEEEEGRFQILAASVKRYEREEREQAAASRTTARAASR
ncbi:MAG TPA: hypothetical protein VML19_04210 [Verrucomicrobiae bacterium]|nr:hypothetical protein [Verrucomicrobiae bacterium]